MRFEIGLAALSIGAFLAAPAGAEGPGTDAYGTADASVTTIVSSSFTPRSSLTQWADDLDGFRSSPTANAVFRAGIPLPTGADVIGVELDACDTDPAGLVDMLVVECGPPVNGPSCQPIVSFFTGAAATPGCGRFPAAGGMLPFTVRAGYTYMVDVTDTDTTAATRFRAVRFVWKRQVSMASGSSTFADVPNTHFAYRFIEALARSGVTGGCATGQFCPDAPVTRAQMAVFLATALGLHWPN